ncbi:MAG: hypothetical protein HBSAPP03_08290 [Phycisphaerae bacterium]|nr:MAG: hypothetical protein HBSAPP03_08290 [Phycisphaerae bacterium]
MFSSTWNRAAIMSAGVMSATAVAQPSYHASWSKVELGAWTLTPVYSEEGGAVLSVDGFLALADPSTRLGDNIVAVWYERTAEGWSAKSWGTDDPWKAIATVKELMGIGDDEDERWDAPSMGDPDAAPAVPEEYVVGVLADDPMAALIAASPERDSIILTMVALGYQAADVPVDGQDECSLAAKMDGLAAAILETLTGDAGTAMTRAQNTWLASPAAACGSISKVGLSGGVTVTPFGPWSPPVYSCQDGIIVSNPSDNLPGDNGILTCRKETWTETRTQTETRTKICITGIWPPSISVITQSRTCSERRITECAICSPRDTQGSPPCPPAGTPPPAKPLQPPAGPQPIGRCAYDQVIPVRIFPWSANCGPWSPVCP